MINKFKTLGVKYAALNLRERWMVFVAGLAVIYAVMNFILLSPTLTKYQSLQAEFLGNEQEISDVQQQITTLSHSPAESIDEQNKRKIEKLNVSLEAQKKQFLTLHKALVSPDDITGLLKSLMRNFEGVRLVSMKTLAPENYLKKSQQRSAASNADEDSEQGLNVIYKHGLELTFSGEYMELMQYAEALQTHSDKVLWDKAELRAKAFPINELTITVYTLSLDKAWLSI